jgi:MFS family permease
MTAAELRASAGVPPAQVRDSLRHSLYDGCGWGVMHGSGERYIAPLVIMAYHGVWPLAAIAALPGLLGALVQCFAADVVDRLGIRKRVFVTASLIQALTWIPMAVSLFLPPGPGYALLLTCFALYVALQNFGFPAWNSLMGDLVPTEQRGRYFGLRNALVGGSIILAFFLSGGWLTLVRSESFTSAQPSAEWQAETAAGALAAGLSMPQLGFLVLFLTALGARLFSVYHLTFMTEPAYRRTAADHFSFLEFLRRARHGDFGWFAIYWAAIHVGIGFQGPFFHRHLLEDRAYPPAVYALIITLYLLGMYASQPFWGRLADRVGNKRVLTLGALGITVVPVLLLFCASAWHFSVVMLVDGACYAAMQLASANYLFDTVTPPKRARCTAYLNVFFAGGFALGVAAGAGAVTVLPFWPEFTVILAGSVALRAVANGFLLRSFREMRLTGRLRDGWRVSN